MFELSLVQKIIVAVPPILLAVILHEVAHGWVANQFGDKTARRMGRLSFDPRKHIDLIGTIAVPALLLSFTPFIFGWAKPVPISYNRLKKPRRDMAFVALAGPAANLLMFIFWAVAMKLGFVLYRDGADWISYPLIFMSGMGIFSNISMIIFNMLPIPPLDGSRILMSFMPKKWALNYLRYGPIGLVILVGLLFSGILDKITRPAYDKIVYHVMELTGGNIDVIVRNVFN